MTSFIKSVSPCPVPDAFNILSLNISQFHLNNYSNDPIFQLYIGPDVSIFMPALPLPQLNIQIKEETFVIIHTSITAIMFYL